MASQASAILPELPLLHRGLPASMSDAITAPAGRRDAEARWMGLEDEARGSPGRFASAIAAAIAVQVVSGRTACPKTTSARLVAKIEARPA